MSIPFTSDCATTVQKRVPGGRKMSGRFTRCEHDRLVSMDVLKDGTYSRRRECSHSPVRKKRSSRSRTPRGVTPATTRRRSRSSSFQHPRTAKSKAMAKAKAAMADFRAKKDAARKARAAARQGPSTPLKPVTQKAKRKARYETPKKVKTATKSASKTPIVAPKSGHFAKKLDFHTKHESNYFDDHEWKADLASEDEDIAFDLRKPDNTVRVGGFRVPSLPPRKRLSLASQSHSAASSGRSTPVNGTSQSASDAKKRRRRLADGAWSIHRDGEMFSDDDDEYDSDIERDDYPQRMRRRVGRDTFADVWKYSRKRRRKTSGKKKSATKEHDFKEEDLVAAEPKSLDDPTMAYFSGLPMHPTLPYQPAERIAVPRELVYDERGNIPGSLDAMTDDEAKQSWGLVFGRDYNPSGTIPDLSDIPGVKPIKRQAAQSPSSRAVALYSPLNLEEIYEREQSNQSETTSASWSPFTLVNSVASWAGSWFKSAPQTHTPIAAAA